MTVKYDSALSALLHTLRAANIELSTPDVIVVRDASGRLGVVFRLRRPAPPLREPIKAALGAYALPEPVLPSALYDTVKDGGVLPQLLLIDGEDVEFYLADRRVVGMDWLSEFLPPSGGTPRLVFGSMKGGVGRTTALAVLAADLARHGYKVLCLDLDLEAPGLGSMLLRVSDTDDRRPKYGVLDYLVENGIGGIEDEELFDYVGISHFSDGFIHVVPAVGRVTDDHPENMVGKLARGLTEDVDSTGQRKTIAQQVRELIDRFSVREEYDAVLIDARAGLSEMTASTWLGVGARTLVLFGTDQSQTFQGYRYVLSHLVRNIGIQTDDWRDRLSFVQAKAPNLPSKRMVFRENLHKLCSELLYDVDEGPDVEPGFNFPFSAQGIGVPHDATYVEYHPAYDAFEPLADGVVLDPAVYHGPFSAFLTRSWDLLQLERKSVNA